MRKLKFKEFLLLGGVIVAFFSCQQSFDEEIDLLSNNDEVVAELRTSKSMVNSKVAFMPVDSVPEWIKEKVSSEEYKLWETVSSKFKIDYSILEHSLTQKQKETLYTTVSALAKDIENGKITEYMGLFTAANLSEETVVPRRMLKDRTEGGGDEGILHDTGLHYICYFEEAKATMYVGAEYYIWNNMRKKYAEVSFSYYEISSEYGASYDGYPIADYMSAYQAIRFRVGGSLTYMHPLHGLSQLYFPDQELLVPISLN